MEEDRQFVRTTADPIQIEKITIIQFEALSFIGDDELSRQQSGQNRLQMPVAKEKRRSKP
jgi:hypothetical protein